MSTNTLLKRITVDPEICFGKPSVRDTRIPVELVLEFLEANVPVEEIRAWYPELEEEDFAACQLFAQEHSLARKKPRGEYRSKAPTRLSSKSKKASLTRV